MLFGTCAASSWQVPPRTMDRWWATTGRAAFAAAVTDASLPSAIWWSIMRRVLVCAASWAFSQAAS
ncbi:hypothetical protein LUX05_05990 [Streptomyces somaliensis]|nr:hypothetical protein [Streptomyces somaliensis]